MKNDIIYVDHKGYDQLLDKLKELEAKLNEVYLEKAEAYSGAVGDGWHDNFAFDEANRKERMIIQEIRSIRDKISKVQIVERQNDENLIDINDIITINYLFDDNSTELFEFKLVGTSAQIIDVEIPEISINSPLGKSVYHQAVGNRTTFTVNNNTFNIEIINKKNENSIQNAVK